MKLPRGFEPGPLKWDVNKGGYVTQLKDRTLNGFVLPVNSKVDQF